MHPIVAFLSLLWLTKLNFLFILWLPKEFINGHVLVI